MKTIGGIGIEPSDESADPFSINIIGRGSLLTELPIYNNPRYYNLGNTIIDFSNILCNP